MKNWKKWLVAVGLILAIIVTACFFAISRQPAYTPEEFNTLIKVLAECEKNLEVYDTLMKVQTEMRLHQEARIAERDAAKRLEMEKLDNATRLEMEKEEAADKELFYAERTQEPSGMTKAKDTIKIIKEGVENKRSFKDIYSDVFSRFYAIDEERCRW